MSSQALAADMPELGLSRINPENYNALRRALSSFAKEKAAKACKPGELAVFDSAGYFACADPKSDKILGFIPYRVIREFDALTAPFVKSGLNVEIVSYKKEGLDCGTDKVFCLMDQAAKHVKSSYKISTPDNLSFSDLPAGAVVYFIKISTNAPKEFGYSLPSTKRVYSIVK